ncbi:MAG: hypothetical protein VX278_20630 [Myxococcota bacterium]|nr:hypothetical protein [Myxococcota bacterium]
MPRPFEIQPDVLAAIRPMRIEDIPRVTELHRQAMGQSLWAKLGPRFLRSIYKAMLSSPLFLGFVYEQEGGIEGFIAGSIHLSQMMRSIGLRHGHRLGISLLFGLRDPSVAKTLLETAQYFRKSKAGLAEEIHAESMFCSFTPKTRGKRISGHINKVLFDTLHARGCQYVKITTETDNIGANRQLQSWGFESKGTFHFYEKEMICYILDLSKSDRVDAKDWLREYA